MAGGLGLPEYDFDAVLAAVPPAAAIDRVRQGFISFAEGEWSMPSKVYLQSPPHGDFRAMPALGDGIAILKWVTSFPDNPKEGRPVVYGTVLASDAMTGEPKALIDGRAVTALRTGAAAAVAGRTLAKHGARTAGIVGCGLHGRWAGLCLKVAGYSDGVCADSNDEAAESLAAELGWRTGTVHEATECDVVTLVTPGHDPVVGIHALRPGLHINALGADGPGKAEMDVDAVLACEVFCDEWHQASHGGELTGAVESGRLQRSEVTDIGDVLTGAAPGRSSDEAVTLFDSTGLAIQDLAIVLALLEDAG
jgi:ornithine cyclodeaminase/alanine dehydrogenase-like protein (mu-crystallin family)